MSDTKKNVADSYQYKDSKRLNLPSAGKAADGKVKEVPKHRLNYDPHLPPALRFDPTGQDDGLRANIERLMAEAKMRPLKPEEADLIVSAVQNRQPWLEWAGKKEAQKTPREVEPVTLHVHERVSTQAILKVAARQDVARNLFADPELEYREAVQFYQHEVAWANRLILGDSLQVMTSLAHREDLTGRVQMIYMDPPYGIKFASNFQSEIGNRDVKEKEQDLTREPEMVKAYRDTWTLGVHSYLAYLRDRLTAAKELLAESGSIFIQISDENLHRVRLLMDEVFGSDNNVGQLIIQKTGSVVGAFVPSNTDYILWYAREHSQAERKFRRLYASRKRSGMGGTGYNRVEEMSGSRRSLKEDDFTEDGELKDGLRLWRSYPLTSDGYRETTTKDFTFRDQTFHPGNNRHWGIVTDELTYVSRAERLTIDDKQISFVRYWDDSPSIPLGTYWGDVGGSGDRVYVVQTNAKVIERCMLMSTAPGDLVLDPTCGSGTTAYVAEQWGRRWITIDASRVALSIARQRLLTAKYDYYTLQDEEKGVSGNFVYKTVPHITLKSIAQNQALDPIFAEWKPKLDTALAACNQELTHVTPALRNVLKLKLATKERDEGKKAITEADRRRWLLPTGAWQHWEIPFDTDDDYPDELKTAVEAYRKMWRARMDAVNACIAASAVQEELVDQPKVDRNRLRVSGPFTVEGVFPVEDSLDLESPIGGAPEALETFIGPGQAEVGSEVPTEALNASAYLGHMIRLLKDNGVRFPNNKDLQFSDLRPLSHPQLHAEGEWISEGEERKVAVVFGPQVGPITAKMVEEAIRPANRRGYDDLIFAGFVFDGAAQAAIQDDPNPNLHIHMSHISPDVTMGDLLKDTKNSQLFTVSGLPQVKLESKGNGEYIVTLEGVDIYNPVDNTVYSAKSDKVAAWFLDADYDGGCFCITQAFFPDPKAWEKLSKALTGVVDADRFAALSGTVSLRFRAGANKRIAIKVIDPRGNEVMCVRSLEGVTYA
jgi:adenine-specific DNA-methyltransferase